MATETNAQDSGILPTDNLTKNKSNMFIVNPWYDSFFFIFSPIVALVLGWGITTSPALYKDFYIFGHVDSIKGFFIQVFIFAHLFIVFFRSHGNKQIFKRFPYRFTLVPILLFVAMVANSFTLLFVSVVATFWDVYHSSMQTFGLGRIYDSKRKNPVDMGRKLDARFNLLMYAGPIVGGASLYPHIIDFEVFASWDSVYNVFFTNLPGQIMEFKETLTYLMIAIAIPSCIYYVYKYWQFSKQGYHVSWQKVALMLSTGVVSVFAWGFNSFGEAFFIMNFFHALQYFAIIWLAEKRNMADMFDLDINTKFGRYGTLLLFLVIGLSAGVLLTIIPNYYDALWALGLVVSVMHFWYDAFIWSIEKKMV